MKGREIVAWNVRRLRVVRGISSEALAAVAGVDRVYLGRIERGIANPTIDILERLASTLGIEMAELFVVPSPDTERPAALSGGRPRGRSGHGNA
jgi:transcriptional regulator with XRE-family HTH domain